MQTKNRFLTLPATFGWLLILFSATALSAAAQSAIQFNRLYNCPKSSLYNFKVLECANEQNCQVAFYAGYEPNLTFSYKGDVAKSRINEAFSAGSCTIDGKPLEAEKESAPTPPRNDNGNNPPSRNDTENNSPKGELKPAQAGRFKVGERVLASPAAMIADEEFEKCTVIQDYLQTEGYDTYQVLCDNPNGGIGRKANVKVPYIKAWANATAAPAAPECDFNEPAGKVSKISKPTAETFKRVIFERLRDTANGRQVGTTFETFQLGKTYVNRLTGRGLMHDGAPQNAMIYPVKTKFIFCDKHTDSTIRWVYDAQYECFKNNFGEWVCPNRALKLSEPIYLPNK